MYIKVTVQKDRDKFYFDEEDPGYACAMSVSCKSQVIGYESLVMEESSSPCIDFGKLGDVAVLNAPGTQKFLKIIDPIKGPLWLQNIVSADGLSAAAATAIGFYSACACCVPAGGGGGGSTAVPFEFRIGTPEAEDAGIFAGDGVITLAGMANHNVLFFRDFGVDGTIDMGDGSAFHTKNLADDFITLSQNLADDEHILIVIL